MRFQVTTISSQNCSLHHAYNREPDRFVSAAIQHQIQREMKLDPLTALFQSSPDFAFFFHCQAAQYRNNVPLTSASRFQSLFGKILAFGYVQPAFQRAKILPLPLLHQPDSVQ